MVYGFSYKSIPGRKIDTFEFIVSVWEYGFYSKNSMKTYYEFWFQVNFIVLNVLVTNYGFISFFWINLTWKFKTERYYIFSHFKYQKFNYILCMYIKNRNVNPHYHAMQNLLDYTHTYHVLWELSFDSLLSLIVRRCHYIATCIYLITWKLESQAMSPTSPFNCDEITASQKTGFKKFFIFSFFVLFWDWVSL